MEPTGVLSRNDVWLRGRGLIARQLCPNNGVRDGWKMRFYKTRRISDELCKEVVTAYLVSWFKATDVSFWRNRTDDELNFGVSFVTTEI